MDEEAASFYRALPGVLGNDLRRVLKDEDGETVMAIIDGRCPMWRTDGLCRIQAELGHEALCKTCREFPRLTHDYGDFIEMGLELSCPEAARIILGTPNQRTQPPKSPAARNRSMTKKPWRFCCGPGKPCGPFCRISPGPSAKLWRWH